jgi:hypothetical protein
MFVLYQLANEKGSLQSADGATYVCVRGCFATKESALRYASRYNVEIRIAPLKNWTICLNGSTDHAVEEIHFKGLMEAYDTENETAETRVKDNVLQKVPGTFDERIFIPLQRSGGAVEERLEENPKSVLPEIPTPAGQNVCLVAIVPDIFHEKRVQELQTKRITQAKADYISTKNGIYRSSGEVLEEEPFYATWNKDHPHSELPGDEPLLMFLGIYETESKAKESLVEHETLNVPKACISMGRWIRIRDLKTVKTERTYADPKLQILMNALHKAQDNAQLAEQTTET